MRAGPLPDSFYAAFIGEAPPTAPSMAEQVHTFLVEVDAPLRREHEEDYCGIVYADSVSEPTFIKIFDPNNFGMQCGFSDNPPLPGWVMSLISPTDLQERRPLQRTGIEKRLLVDGTDGQNRRKPDHSVLRLLARAQQYHAMLMRGGDKTITQLAHEAGVTGSYFSRVLRLSFLAPSVTTAILRNRQPLALTAKRLANETHLPMEWEEQRTLLGIG